MASSSINLIENFMLALNFNRNEIFFLESLIKVIECNDVYGLSLRFHFTAAPKPQLVKPFPSEPNGDGWKFHCRKMLSAKLSLWIFRENGFSKKVWRLTIVDI